MSASVLELLAPARDAETGRVAVLAGADAVYIGAPAFGARSSACNSVEDITTFVRFAHQYRVRVYVTMNTVLFDNELEEAQKMVWDLYAAGVDALIVQDMAYLEMSLPPIALHASTQCDIRTPEKAYRLAQAGFSQLVLPREFTLEEIRAARDAAGVPVEVFVHGALCVSYSGDCQAGCVAMDRSANRGMCPQMCRLPYRLVDKDGNDVAPEKHYLSLRDMNQSANLEKLVEAGASSFKIEGRLKDARYVANVTAAYSRRLNDIIAASGGRYVRSSAGESACGFQPDLRRTFNRGYTNYFLSGAPARMGSIDTPKWAGMPVGKVVSYDRTKGVLTARLDEKLNNGDGLGYFDRHGVFCGFRLNKAEGNRLFPARELSDIHAGTVIYRNSDKAFFDILDRPDASCRRVIDVDVCLDGDGGNLYITANDARGCSVTIAVGCPFAEARSEQKEQHQKVFSKTGDTIYRLRSLDDRCENRFIAASVLTTARRSLFETLDKAAEACYVFDRRKACVLAPDAFATLPPLTYHDNVANNLAEKFYGEHGARIEEKAIEVTKPEGEVQVMSTRYCIRRELGACLKTNGARKFPSPLFLKNDSGIYRLDFDCLRCGMNVVKCS